MDVASEKLSQCRSAASYILYEDQQMMIAVITKRFLVLYNCMGQVFHRNICKDFPANVFGLSHSFSVTLTEIYFKNRI